MSNFSIPTQTTFAGWIMLPEGKMVKVTADRESNASAQKLLEVYAADRGFNTAGDLYVVESAVSHRPIAKVKFTVTPDVELMET